MPRSILDISDFKASEVMNCLWYYLRYSLVGLLDSKIVKNFEKLSAGCYILCKDRISEAEKNRGCELLIEFADEFEKIYGKGAITMNIHCLRHYRSMIDHCGLLWAHSLFSFENNIGVIKMTLNGTTDYLEQITKNYAAARTVIQCAKPSVNQKTTLKNKFFIASKNMTVWKKLIMKGVTYTSLLSETIKSIDYFIQTKDKKIGKIEYFFYQNTEEVFQLYVYENSFQNYHWAEVEPTNQYQVYKCCEIEKKLLYFRVGVREWITEEPNPYSRSAA